MEQTTCGWLVETSEHPGECYPDDELGYCTLCEGWAENGGWGIVECGAHVTDLGNGWECEAGHSHYYGAEYFDEDEVAGMRRAGYAFPANALAMDGSQLR